MIALIDVRFSRRSWAADSVKNDAVLPWSIRHLSLWWVPLYSVTLKVAVAIRAGVLMVRVTVSAWWVLILWDPSICVDGIDDDGCIDNAAFWDDFVKADCRYDDDDYVWDDAVGVNNEEVVCDRASWRRVWWRCLHSLHRFELPHVSDECLSKQLRQRSFSSTIKRRIRWFEPINFVHAKTLCWSPQNWHCALLPAFLGYLLG